MQIQNPDGSPAVDALVVAVLDGPVRPTVDTALRPIVPMSSAEGNQVVPQLIHPLDNSGGVVVADGPEPTRGESPMDRPAVLAIVATSPQGFAFHPAAAFDVPARLRPWGRLVINSTAIPEDRRATTVISVQWACGFAGSYPAPVRSDGRPYAGDWRFDRLLTRLSAHSLDQFDGTVLVPPGEITVRMAEYPGGSVSGAACQNLDDAEVAIVRVRSGESAVCRIPETGTAAGKLVMDIGLPDWGQPSLSDQPDGFVLAIPSNKLNADLWSSTRFSRMFDGGGSRGQLEDYFQYLESSEGFARRQQGVGTSRARLQPDGTFRFAHLLEGKYTLALMPTARLRSGGSETEEPLMLQPLYPVDGQVSRSMGVRRGTMNDLGSVTTRRGDVEAGTGLSANAPIAEARLEAVGETPSQGSGESPAVPVPGAGGAVGAGAVAGAGGVAGAGDSSAVPEYEVLVRNWLRDHADGGSPDQLREQLSKMLEQDFDARMAAREAEISRLQALLDQSREALRQRQTRRGEILKSKLQALMLQAEQGQSAADTPSAGSTRQE